MGSTLKFDSDRRELVRERRQARVQRKHERRRAREDKQTTTTTATTVVLAFEIPAADGPIMAPVIPDPASGAPVPAKITDPAPAPTPDPASADMVVSASRAPQAARAVKDPTAGSRVSRRERDIAAFEARRAQVLEIAGEEARARLERNGQPATVADALAALATGGAEPWSVQRVQVDRELERGRAKQVAAGARRAMWAVSRDAARTSKRARTDPELALAVCVAYAILAAAPATAIASVQRTRCPARATRRTPHALWR